MRNPRTPTRVFGAYDFHAGENCRECGLLFPGFWPGARSGDLDKAACVDWRFTQGETRAMRCRFADQSWFRSIQPAEQPYVIKGSPFRNTLVSKGETVLERRSTDRMC